MAKRIPNICMIVPSEKMAENAKKMIIEQDEKIGVYVASLDNCVDVAKMLIDGGAVVLISRKGTAARLRKNLTIPVVDIPSLTTDYVEMLTEAKKYDGFVAFFSYDDIPVEVQTISKMIGVELRLYEFKNEKEAGKSVQKALEDGAAFGFGGVITQRLAEKEGLKYMPLENSEESLHMAIQTAKSVLEVRIAEHAQQKKLRLELERNRTVINLTRDAVVYVNEKGIIEVINAVAEALFKVARNNALGKDVRTFVNDAMLWKILETGVPLRDYLVEINKTMVAANCSAIVLGRRIQGVVAIFRDIKIIQKSEKAIRLGLYEKGLVAKYNFSDIIGRSEKIKDAIRVANQYAGSKATVLITGETGVGKEVFAQSIHNASAWREGPFIAVNCANMDANSLVTELFGYEKGSNPARLRESKAGLFELAHGGTIFLDEIGSLPLELQGKLLRVLQEKEVRRLGSIAAIGVDTRVIASTNRDLMKAVRNGEFREDLYYRIRVLTLDIPPLRQRRGDIFAIAEYFFKQFSEEHYELQKQRFYRCLNVLGDYSWPGNVRELRNYAECAAVLFKQENTDEVLLNWGNQFNQIKEEETEDIESFVDLEQKSILRALRRNHMVISDAAKELGMSRTTLWRRMKKYNIQI